MRQMRSLFTALLGIWFLVGGSPVWAASNTTEAQQPPSDLKINTEIKAAFDRDNHIDLSKVDVQTKNGIVTLSGTVLTDYEKAYATQLASDVRDHLKKGKEIVNNITVIFPADQDLVLAKEIRSDLLQNPAVHVSKLKVAVKGGSVQLQGFVSSDEQKKRVDKIVQDRKQVASLKDDLVILPK
ncbi:MAG: BON domain-containing protein [Nitrospirae bacterium]|nr:BON domain-containing protein [Candidatus Manganitrophaceae bacterium]